MTLSGSNFVGMSRPLLSNPNPITFKNYSWEYPNHEGIGCNTISDDDSANFLSFLQELRQDPTGAKLTLTAAVGLTPFAGPGGTPMADVSDFAAVLNHIGTS